MEILRLDNEVHVWYTNSTDNKHDLTALWQTLTSEERIRADRFITPILRRNFIIARGVLRQLLAYYTQIPATAIAFKQNAYGKISLETNNSTLQNNHLEFNLSHSGDLILYAFTLKHAIGVDIEKIRPIKDSHVLAKRFFSSKEIIALNALPKDDHQVGFFTCWTRKEAFIKALGIGLSYPLNKFTVSIDQHPKHWTLQIENTEKMAMAGVETNFKNWSFLTLNQTPKYAAALAIQGKIDKILNFEY